MAKFPETSQAADPVVGALLSVAADGQAQAIDAWGRTCETYARYFSQLAKARGPEDLLAANTQLAMAVVDVLAASPVSPPRGDGATAGPA